MFASGLKEKRTYSSSSSLSWPAILTELVEAVVY
jgi:hypothetical protein